MDILWQLNKLEPGYWKSERATFLIRTFLKMHDTLMDFDSRLCWWRCSFIRHCTKRSSHESSLWFPSWWDPLQCICFSTPWLGTPEEVTWFCQWTTWKLPHFQNSPTGYKAGILKSFSQCLLHPAKHYAGAQKSLRAFYLFLSDVYFLPLLQAFILTSHTKSPLLTNVWQHPFINFLLFASVSFP